MFSRPKPASPVKAVQPETTVKPPTASIPLTKPANSETAASGIILFFLILSF